MRDHEKRAHERLAYWQHRLDMSAAGRDSRDPNFLYLAERMRDFWTGEVTQLELDYRRAA